MAEPGLDSPAGQAAGVVAYCEIFGRVVWELSTPAWPDANPLLSVVHIWVLHTDLSLLTDTQTLASTHEP